MNNERAIELLHRLQDEQFDGQHGDERREALEMAIRAMEEPKTAGSGSLDLEQPEIKTDRTTGDCINRQQAIEAVRNAEYRFRIKSNSYFKDYVEEVREIAKQITDAHAKALEDLPPAERARFWIDSEGKISALPSAQPQRKKGHWIRHITTGLGPKLNDTIECSECRIAFSTENMFRRSFCPNCGADMRGEKDD